MTSDNMGGISLKENMILSVKLKSGEKAHISFDELQVLLDPGSYRKEKLSEKKVMLSDLQKGDLFREVNGTLMSAVLEVSDGHAEIRDLAHGYEYSLDTLFDDGEVVLVGSLVAADLSLEKCPFCGGSAELYEDKQESSEYYVTCTICGISTPWTEDKLSVVARWNRRCGVEDGND